MRRNIFFVVNFLLVVALGVYVLWQPKNSGNAYVLNQKLFDGFKGKRELEQKLVEVRTANREKLDSLAQVIAEGGRNTGILMPLYQTWENEFRLREQEMSDRYTADIWKRINDDVMAFGKENGFAFIFGASGDGSLMYADGGYDITDRVVEYLNRRYDEGLAPVQKIEDH